MENSILTFEETRTFVRNLKFESYSKNWRQYCASEDFNKKIPKAPDHAYKGKGWIYWADFLGSEKIATFNKVFIEFTKAKEFVQKLKIKNTKEWNAYCGSGNKPDNIPVCPQKTYKNSGWISFADWLGTNNMSGQQKHQMFLSFMENGSN